MLVINCPIPLVIVYPPPPPTILTFLSSSSGSTMLRHAVLLSIASPRVLQACIDRNLSLLYIENLCDQRLTLPRG